MFGQPCYRGLSFQVEVEQQLDNTQRSVPIFEVCYYGSFASLVHISSRLATEVDAILQGIDPHGMQTYSIPTLGTRRHQEWDPESLGPTRGGGISRDIQCKVILCGG